MKLDKKWEYVIACFVIAVIAIVLIGYITGGTSGGSDRGTATATEPETAQTPPAQESDVPETKPEPVETAQEVGNAEQSFNWTSAEVTEDNIKKALKDNVGAAMAIPLTDDSFRKFVTSADTKGEYVEITINPGMFADYKDFVKRAGGSLIAYSKVLFENSQVYEVSLNVLIDNVGGGENDGVYISWRREQAEGVDYDAILDNMFGDYTIPYQLARKYSIQKDIYEELEEFELPSSNNL